MDRRIDLNQRIEDVEGTGPRGPSRIVSLKSFAEKRRADLLDHPEVAKIEKRSPDGAR